MSRVAALNSRARSRATRPPGRSHSSWSMMSHATIAPIENTVATDSRSGPRESASCQRSEVTTAKAPAARAAARAPDRPVINRQGRLARTMPASSLA